MKLESNATNFRKFNNDKKYSNKCLLCFDFNSWCCYKFLPKNFKGASIKNWIPLEKKNSSQKQELT